MWYKISTIYVGDHQRVRPKKFNFSYNFKGWSLDGFKNAWWKDIYTNGAYAFDADWLYQTSWSNDRWITCAVEIPSLSNAKKIEWYLEWSFTSWSWANNKAVAIGDGTWAWSMSSFSYVWTFSMSTVSNNSWIQVVATNRRPYQIHPTPVTWTLKETFSVDLTTWEAEWNVENGGNLYSWTGTLTDSELAQIKTATYASASWTRWYHTFDATDRLHLFNFNIEFD